MTSIIKGYLKLIGLLLASIATMYFIYYLLWFSCLLNEHCYSQNFGV